MSLLATEPQVRAMRTVGHHGIGYQAFQGCKRSRCICLARHRLSFHCVTKQKITLLQRSSERLAKDFGYEGIGTCQSDFRSILFGNPNGFADGMLAGVGVGKYITFYKEPFRVCHRICVYVAAAN